MAFKLYSRKINKDTETLERGQEWYGERVEENLASCDFEGCSELFESYFSRSSLILEAGCGLGRWVLYFKKRNYRIMGCEINHSALREAKRFDPSADMITADIRRLPFKDEQFDVLISLGVIEHFKGGPIEILKEKKRILKPRGILIVAVPFNSLFRKIIVNRLIVLKMLILKTLKFDVVFTEYRYSRKELLEFLNVSGFETLSCHPEMLQPPRHVGSYVDYIHLTGRVPGNKFDVPAPMRMLTRLIKSVSPWLISGMIMCVARKNT